MKKSQASKRKKTPKSDLVTLPLRVHRGMIKFIKDHAAILKETLGTRTPKEYFEHALEEDFDAQVDGMRLNHEEIYRKYGIPDPEKTEPEVCSTATNPSDLTEKATQYLTAAKQDPSLPQFKDETELTEFAVQEFLSKHSEA